MIHRHQSTPTFHAVVEHGGIVYVSGIVGRDLGLGMREQTASALEKLAERLRQAGSDPSKVLMATVYITDMALKAEMNESWVAFFDAANLPARATIGVADLGPGVLIEIVTTATR